MPSAQGGEGAERVRPEEILEVGPRFDRSPFSCHQEAAAGGLISKEERSPQTLTLAGEDTVKTPSPTAEEAGEPETKGNS